MPMQAHIHTNALGDITVHMKGDLDYENSISFKKELENLVNENPKSLVVLDMYSLDFVGSSGIGFFVKTLNNLKKNRKQVKLANVKLEFLKVFKLYNLESLEEMILDFDSNETEELNKIFGKRKYTFEN